MAPSLEDYLPEVREDPVPGGVLGAMNGGPRVPEFPEDPRRQFQERMLRVMNSGPRVPEFPESREKAYPREGARGYEQ